jgi:hypothetical protein
MQVRAPALAGPSTRPHGRKAAVVAAMRLASLRWGLKTPVAADLSQKIAPKPNEGDGDPPRGGAVGKPR